MGISLKNFATQITSAIIINLVFMVVHCFAESVQLSWDANTESTLAGYKVYYKADSADLPFDGATATEGVSPLDVKQLTSATISGLDPAHTYYFAVTAYDTSGVESSYSNIVSVPESIAPTISLTSPAINSSVTGSVSVTANATDNVGVVKVEFYINGVLAASEVSAPYLYTWNTTALSAGSYVLSARAYDAAGNVGQSGTVAVTVLGDSIAPTITMTAPANNATVSGSVAVCASASDNIGVSKVEFFVDGALNAAVNTSPYCYNWNTTAASNGSHLLSARAYDAVGNASNPGTATVTVSNTSATSSATGGTGDVNGDGVVDIADALLALQMTVGNLQPSIQELQRGDVAPLNAPDGKIDMGDVILILSKVVGTSAN